MNDNEILLKIAEKEYKQAWTNYENAIEYNDTVAQEIFAELKGKLHWYIRCLKKEIAMEV